MDCGEFKIEENVALAKYTTWQIGGCARYFVNADSSNIVSIVKYAKSKKLKYAILGAGSNVLIPSGGVDGLVIRYANKNFDCAFCDGILEVSAGASLAMLLKYCTNAGFADLCFLAGIPGTVGGAIFMNAGISGTEKKEISDCLKSAVIIDKFGNLKSVARDYFEFGYRKSILQKTSEIVVSAVFNLSEPNDKNVILERIKKTVNSRLKKQPKNRKNCGSVFKACGGVPAGILIEKAGLKGAKEGGAMVSFEHANWIENLGSASSDDVLNLIAKIKAQVFENFGAKLEEEVRILDL